MPPKSDSKAAALQAGKKRVNARHSSDAQSLAHYMATIDARALRHTLPHFRIQHLAAATAPPFCWHTFSDELALHLSSWKNSRKRSMRSGAKRTPLLAMMSRCANNVMHFHLHQLSVCLSVFHFPSWSALAPTFLALQMNKSKNEPVPPLF